MAALARGGGEQSHTGEETGLVVRDASCDALCISVRDLLLYNKRPA
jgi:hypothetical protein